MGNMGNMNMNNMNDQAMMMNMMQMMMNNNMGNMNMMNNNMNMGNMGNMNMGNNGGWSLIFSKKNGAQKVTIQINPEESVGEAISKYVIKSLDQNQNKYIFNGKQLATCLSVSQSGLQNGSEISVISIGDVEGA